MASVGNDIAGLMCSVSMDWYDNNTSGDVWYGSDVWYRPWSGVGVDGDTVTVLPYYAIEGDEEMSNYKRGLFHVYVVDPEGGTVLYQSVLVADSRESAKFQVLHHTMNLVESGKIEGGFTVEDLDVVIVLLGNVRDRKDE